MFTFLVTFAVNKIDEHYLPLIPQHYYKIFF